MLAINKPPPASRQPMPHQAARLGPAARQSPLAGQPEQPLGAQQPAVAPRTAYEAVKTLRMKRAVRSVHGRANTVFLRFRNVLAAQFLQPTRRFGSPLEIEQAGIEYLAQRDVTHHHWQDVRVSVEVTQDRRQLRERVSADQITLADQDDISELDLLDQQVGNRTLVVLTQGFAAAGETGGLFIVVQEVDPIDDRNHRIESGHISQSGALPIPEGKGLCDRQRLGYAGGLDQQVVISPLFRQPADFLQQVLTQGAADAAVAHLNQPFLRPIQGDIPLDLVGVDIDFTHVVDDNGNAQSVTVFKNGVKQRTFSSAQEAGQDSDR